MNNVEKKVNNIEKIIGNKQTQIQTPEIVTNTLNPSFKNQELSLTPNIQNSLESLQIGQPIEFNDANYNSTFEILKNIIIKIKDYNEHLKDIITKIIDNKTKSSQDIAKLTEDNQILNTEMNNVEKEIEKHISESLNDEQIEQKDRKNIIETLKNGFEKINLLNKKKDDENKLIMAKLTNREEQLTEIINLINDNGNLESIQKFLGSSPEQILKSLQEGGFNWRTPKSKSSSQRVKLQTKRSKRSVSSVNKKYKTQRNKKLFPFFKNKKNKK